MSNDRIFARTRLGSDVLENPQGILSGDELLLMALIDGHTSLAGIASKVPPSVRVHLDATFRRLLSAQVIEDTGHTAAAGASGSPDSVSEAAGSATPAVVDVEAANLMCAVLEQELATTRAQLEAARARQKEVEAGFHRLKLKVSSYTEIFHAKLTGMLRELDGQTGGAIRMRDDFERGLKDALESLQPLNLAITDQQQVLDNTLSVPAFQAQSSADPIKREREADDAKMAQSHPYYKKLRGLEFFKGFANAELLQFLEIAKWQEPQAGDTVLNEGDVGMPFFIIVSGTVAVFKGSNRLTELEQGDFFGEFAYLSGEEPYRSARVVAETPCELLMVDPLDIEFSPVQLRLHVVEALLRGQVRRTMISSKPMESLQQDNRPGEPDAASL